MEPLAFDCIGIQEIYHPLYTEKDVAVTVLRLDKVHPIISGNKWFKLKNYLQDARDQNKKGIVTFGGPYSNHILATACACKMYQLQSFGIIRGERPARLSETLIQAEHYQMHLVFLNRNDYKLKIVPREIENLNDFYIINEGGYGEKGASGIAEMIAQYNSRVYSHFCCAFGTGTMMAGLIKSALPTQKVIGINVLKNNSGAEPGMRRLLNSIESLKSFQLVDDYHFGGYAKYTTVLIDFMNQYYQATGVPTDFVYTGKLFFSVSDMIKKNSFKTGSHLLVIHSGGLQGNHSLRNGTLIF